VTVHVCALGDSGQRLAVVYWPTVVRIWPAEAGFWPDVVIGSRALFLKFSTQLEREGWRECVCVCVCVIVCRRV
jgi:hypothetical protein